jgi:hypothetical protein
MAILVDRILVRLGSDFIFLLKNNCKYAVACRVFDTNKSAIEMVHTNISSWIPENFDHVSIRIISTKRTIIGSYHDGCSYCKNSLVSFGSERYYLD